MSSRVNLNDNTNDRFEFSIGGLDYDLVYPTLEQLEPMTDLFSQREVAEDSGDKEKIKELDEKISDKMYEMIVPVGHSTPIRDTLKKQSFSVVKAFNKMLAEQLSAE